MEACGPSGWINDLATLGRGAMSTKITRLPPRDFDFEETPDRQLGCIFLFGSPPAVERFAYPERFAPKIENGNDRNTIIGNGVINAKGKSFGKRSMESIFNFMDPPKVS
jgi:hypothetical protein